MQFRKFLTSSLVALVTTTAVFAASDMDTRVSQLEKQMKEVRTETAMDNFGALTASARDDVDGNGWFILFGPVYYYPRVGGTEFAYTTGANRLNVDNATNIYPIFGRTKDMNFKWDWGIRAAVGYNFVHDQWDAVLNYLWFNTSGSKTVDSGLNAFLAPLRATSALIQGCLKPITNQVIPEFFSQSAKSQFDFDYNGLDLELGRDFFVSKMLTLRPHFGLKAAWLDLQQVIRYTGGVLNADQDSPFTGLGVNTFDVKDESDMAGLGPRAGIDTRWYYGCGWSIFGNASASMLYANFDVDHREKVSLCQKTNRIELSANQHRFVPNTQFMLGIRYDRAFKEQCQYITVRLGYDVQYFWRANQMIKPVATDWLEKYDRISEDVGFHGVMLDAKWTF